MRRFLIMVDDATPTQQNLITEFFRGKPQGFWHHFTDAWLIADPTDVWTCESLRDQLSALVPGATTLVMQIDNPKAWAGYGNTQSFTWLHDSWSK